MKFSIIIPYFNRKSLLFNTLQSLDRQTFPGNEYEVILVDDGSEDLKEADIKALQLSMNLTYLRFERNEKSCAAFARNRGIEKARGEYVIFYDCDQIAKDNLLKEYDSFYENTENPETILQISTRFDLEPDQDVHIDRIEQCAYIKEYRYAAFSYFSHNLATLEGRWHLVFSNNISMSRTLLEQYGGFDENFKKWGLEDVELGYRLFKNGVKIVYNPNTETYHQHHRSNYSKELYLGWMDNMRYFVEKHQNLEVMQQYVFRDGLDPDIYAELQEKGITDIWLYCFRRFEESLRIIKGLDCSKTKNKFVITNPALEELKTLLQEKRNRDRYTVVCSRKKLDIITWIQTDSSAAETKLIIV